MKDIRPALRSFLLADADISALVGTRVYTIKMPQGVTADSLVFYRISGAGDYLMAGGLSGFFRQRIQIDAWCEDPDSANTLFNEVRECIDGYRGSMGTGGQEVTIQGVFLLNQGEDYDGEVEMYRVHGDFSFFYEENESSADSPDVSDNSFTGTRISQGIF